MNCAGRIRGGRTVHMGIMVRFRLMGQGTAVRSTLTALWDVADVDSIEEVDE